jgi:hypothetical protein
LEHRQASEYDRGRRRAKRPFDSLRGKSDRGKRNHQKATWRELQARLDKPKSQTKKTAASEEYDMSYRPLSFTKNLGGLDQLYESIRSAYRPGTTLREFEQRLPHRLENRRLVIIQFFLATRLIGRTEYIVEDTLIRTTLAEENGPTLARL